MQSDNLKKIEKIVVNVGVGRLSQQPNFNDKVLPELIQSIGLITGQKPQTRPAKQSIAGFKTRAGQTVGLKATLRGKRSYDFLNRLVKVVLPRVKDFRGIALKNVDKAGHLNFGLKEQFAFPEINPEQSRVNFGLEISIVLNRIKNRDEAIALYRSLGVPLKTH